MGLFKIEFKKINNKYNQELIEMSLELFITITSGDSLYKMYIERFFPQLL